MNFAKAQQLKKKWGDKPCNHPEIVAEDAISGQRTGDYYCTQCGEVGVGREWNKDPKQTKR